MNIFGNAKPGPKRIGVTVAVAFFLAVAVVMAGAFYWKDQIPQESDASTQSTDSTELTSTALSFPYALENGKLEVESVFQFSGFNPDCAGAEGENIAALQLRNLSQEHLTKADITLTIKDGPSINFYVADLPAGASAMVFSTENQSMETSAEPEAFDCKADFEMQSPLMQDKLNISTENMVVTITNTSDEDISNLIVYCHSVLEDACFGGLTYIYKISNVPAGASASVNAVDCYLGGTMVVRIGVE